MKKCMSLSTARIFLMTLLVSLTLSLPALADTPSRVQVGIFFNSMEDCTDSVYVSFNGEKFQKVGEVLRDKTPNDARTLWAYTAPGTNYNVGCLHDPSAQYHAGTFWSMSGWTNGDTFIPMLAASPDLINWSYPNSGSSTNVKCSVTPYGRGRQRDNGNFDVAGPDLFIDDDGTAWIVASFGYFAPNHGDNSQNDVMTPYLIQVGKIAPGYGSQVPTDANSKGAQPKGVSYSQATPINLSQIGTGGGQSLNWIDGSLYKEGGTYYLSIKRDGITNQIWKTNSLSLNSSWSLVCGNVVTGYEGPSLTKLDGNYLMYTDKLADYPMGHSDGRTGIFVTSSGRLDGGWGNTHRISTVDREGNGIPNRHGSVITLTDRTAIGKVMAARSRAGYGDTQPVYRLYNRWSGEHLFTTDKSEYDSLARVGWKQENVGWNAPNFSSTPVYRLYNRWSGDHLYTTDRSEYDKLARIGWTQEGVQLYSGGSRAIYRLFNPYVKVGTHLFTTDANEYERLARMGWRKEGKQLYGM